MLISSIPTKISIPFAASAGAGFTRQVPDASQIGIQDGAASFTDGFPPDCFLPIGAGGTPPWGADFNGLLNQMSAWLRWQQAGGFPINYDAVFSAAVGGYPNGAFIGSATTFGNFWISTADNNTSDPDAGGSNWTPVSLLGGTLTTGAWTWRPSADVVPGWVKANGTTIGSSGSSATQLASASAFNLFSYFWSTYSNTQCPVSGGRGANPTADFAANKTIGTFDMRGIGIMGMDTMGGGATTRLSGVPVTSGAATQAGSLLGENLHTLLLAELAQHNHGVTDPTHFHLLTQSPHSHAVSGGTFGGATSAVVVIGAGTSVPAASTGIGIVAQNANISVDSNTTGITINNSGSNTAHNTVQLSIVGTHYFKL